MLEILDKSYENKKYEKGLSSQEAENSQKKNGFNVLANVKKKKPLGIFLGQFRDFMVMILLVATAVSFFLGEYYDAITIAVIVFLNAVLGFIQEYKTEKTLEALKNMTAPTAKVFRDGKLCEIPSTEVVVGDIISIETGDKIPADANLIFAKGLHTDESLLTGESIPTEKSVENPMDNDNSLGKTNIIYSGTVATKGTGEAKVIAIGTDAQVGKISGMLTEIEEGLTPLQKRLAELGKVVGIICLIVCAVVAAAGILRGEDVFEMLMTGITIAIAAIPEGLPATVTIALALAVGRMLKQNAVVNKLHSVETLGSATVICSDKTGTITENKMTVKKAYAYKKEYDISGDGYKAAGEITSEKLAVNTKSDKDLAELFLCGVLCNNASIYGKKTDSRERGALRKKGEWSVLGDPTEIAVLVAGAKLGLTAENLSEYKKADEIPFDSETRYMATLHKKNGNSTVFMKGSIDVILAKCSFILADGKVSPLTDRIKKEIREKHDNFSDKALRLLAFCKKDLGKSANFESETSNGMIFLGLMGMSDPPRRDAINAIKVCKQAHIKTVMITGDHKNTAKAIATEAKIYRKDDLILTGEELEKLSDDKLFEIIDKVSVYARVKPADKLRIIRAFKKKGEIVAMTGDGVNDAPAIKEASIGVAMGSGTDVTKQAADVVLLDDNFATLVKAVENGRGIYANIRKFVRYLLSCNIGEVLTMFLGIIFGLPIILLPTQILLVNLATDGLPAIALGIEPPEKENMKKPPQKADSSFFSGGLMTKIIVRGVLIGACTLGSFICFKELYGSVDAARTAALFTLIMSQLAHVFECKSESKNIFTVNYLNNPKLILAALLSLIVIFAAIYVPFLQLIFGTVALTSEQILIALAFALLAPFLQIFFK